MLIELRCNVMAKDFFNYIDMKQRCRCNVYMNEETLYRLIDQVRVYKHWSEDAVTTDYYVDAVKRNVVCYLGDYNAIIKY